MPFITKNGKQIFIPEKKSTFQRLPRENFDDIELQATNNQELIKIIRQNPDFVPLGKRARELLQQRIDRGQVDFNAI